MPRDCKGRKISSYSKSSNDRDQLLPDWLRWSLSKQALYCVTCLLFRNDAKSQRFSDLSKSEGFYPLKNGKCYIHVCLITKNHNPIKSGTYPEVN